jgi:hypothetical protein
VHLHADARGRWWARSDNDLRFELRDAAALAGRRVRARVQPDGITACVV